jgi:hypothetical protein
MGHVLQPTRHDNETVPRITVFARFALVLSLMLGQLFALVPTTSAASDRISASWTPNVVDSASLAGTCPTPQNATAACQINRGATYTASASFTVDKDSDALLIDVDGGGLEIEAVARSTGADYTNALAAGGSETIDLTVMIPEVTGRRDRSFYIGRVMLSGGSGRVIGGLTVSVNVPVSRVSWTKQTDPATGERPPITTIVGSGATVTRNLTLVSNTDVTDFGVSTNTDRVALSGVPNALANGDPEEIRMTYTAPTVNRRTTHEVILRPLVGGVQALERALRVKIVILPAEVTWSPPQVRDTLVVQNQTFKPRTIFVTSNYDVGGVRFRTADLGLTPIVSPLGPVDLKAGVPYPVQIRMCPGYAPTTYFLGITAYQGSKPLNKRVQIRMKVEDNGTGLPAPGSSDPCAT